MTLSSSAETGAAPVTIAIDGPAGSGKSSVSKQVARELGVDYLLEGSVRKSGDRIRVTATGELFTCLFAKTGTPMGAQMRAGADDDALTATLRRAVWHKQAGYAATPGPVERPILMHGMGG